MLTIINHTVNKLEDPTGILTGDRYEFILHIDVPEDDDLFMEKGISLKVIYVIDEHTARIAQYHFVANESQEYLEFELDEEEIELINLYCQENLSTEK
jgi:hypothetical protein